MITVRNNIFFVSDTSSKVLPYVRGALESLRMSCQMKSFTSTGASIKIEIASISIVVEWADFAF